ncbi:MAG: hypothetical protein GTN74_15695 [Proteobacteria bacterium]|nr:hypothetical protein [Pseudomonadota bacterium]NIS72061.1 hypothetical protein [Pseudomonadota bacterium]
MKPGEKITFPFGKKQMEGTIKKIAGKTVYIVADFPKHKGKIVKRPVFSFEKGKKKSTKAKPKKTE